MKKRILSAILIVLSTVTAFSGCTSLIPETRENGITVTSSSLTSYGDWLEARLEADGVPATEIVIGDTSTAAEYGLDLSDFACDEGYIIRRDSADEPVLIFGKNAESVDMAVRYFANYCDKSAPLNVVEGESYRIGKITIADHDLSEYVIVNTDPEDIPMAYAAEILQSHLGKACGIFPEIVTEVSEGEFAITLIRDKDGDTYGDENFLIKSHESGITITGGKFRGCLYGAYTFLEEYIGVKFYYRSDAVPVNGDYATSYIYESGEIVIGADDIDFYDEGSFISRCGYSGYPFFSPALKYNGPLYNPGQSDNTNSHLYGNYGVAANVSHGLHNIYFLNADFSEWDDAWDPETPYGSRNPCFTSEPFFDELVRRVIDDLDHRVEVDGFTPMKERYMCCIDISQYDTSTFCMCDDCLAVYAEEGAVSGAIIRHANKMVDALKDTPYSDMYVGCFAYYGTMNPPTKTKPHDQVIVNFCFYLSNNGMTRICANHSYGDANCTTNKYFTDLYEKWDEITNNLYVWYYPTTAYHFAGTTHDLFKLYDDIKYLSECNTYGVMALQDDDPTGLAFIKSYMYQRVMWNAEMSYEEYCDILKEFLFFTYGDGYESVYDYLQIMDRAGNFGGDCWTSIFDTPIQKLDFTFIKINKDLILELYEDALSYATDSYQEMMVREIFKFSRYHIAAATHTEMWLNGNEEQRAWYKENLDIFVSENAGENLFLDWGAPSSYWKYVPAAGTFDYDVNPLDWMRTSLGYWGDNYDF